jgi:hypothetical protein
MTWRDFLLLSPARFEAQCQADGIRGSGPGGQKRNKTSSAVRLTHAPSGISVRAEEERSQSSNRKLAAERLQWRIALHLRGPLDPTPPVGETDPDAPVPPPPGTPLKRLNFRDPVHVAIVLDLLHAHHYSVRDAADALQATTGALAKFLTSNELLLAEVNHQRAARSLKPLRAR